MPCRLPRRCRARPLTEPESLRLLAEFGVRTVATIECNSAADAIAAATRLGYPVVLKGVAEGVAHKSDLGLVHVGLRDPDAVAERLYSRPMSAGHRPGHGPGGLEAIAGVTRADGVGLVLIAGLGGIFAEALHDVAHSRCRPAARSSRLAWRTAPGASPGEPALEASRGRRALSLICCMSLQAAALALGDGLQAIDINPVILGEAGAVAVDALVVPRMSARTAASPSPTRSAPPRRKSRLGHRAIAVEQSVEMPVAAIDDEAILSGHRRRGGGYR